MRAFHSVASGSGAGGTGASARPTGKETLLESNNKAGGSNRSRLNERLSGRWQHENRRPQCLRIHMATATATKIRGFLDLVPGDAADGDSANARPANGASS